MSLPEIQENVLRMIRSVDQNELHSFLKWLNMVSDEAMRDLPLNNADVMLRQIQDEIREALPLNALIPSENIQLPASEMPHEPAAYKERSTVHVDSFLYSDDAIDTLCDEGRMTRNYCQQCGSHQVAPLTFISHSCSQLQIKYIFQFLLRDLQARTLLDVGSRTGAVLYGGYLYSGLPKLIGVEINPDFCTLQQNIIQKYQLEDRIQVICADICSQADILKSADVIILNNVFECFAPIDVQKGIWCFLRECLTRPHTVLITCPSLQESLNNLQTGIVVDTWVKALDVESQLSEANIQFYGSDDPEDSELGAFHVYQVL